MKIDWLSKARFFLQTMAFCLAISAIQHAFQMDRPYELPLVYSIKIRRFIALFLISLPFALLHRMQAEWLVPLITMLVAYPLLALDRIGAELQNPFSEKNLSHLPLTEISATIERNLTALLRESTAISVRVDSTTTKLEVDATPAAHQV